MYALIKRNNRIYEQLIICELSVLACNATVTFCSIDGFWLVNRCFLAAAIHMIQVFFSYDTFNYCKLAS